MFQANFTNKNLKKYYFPFVFVWFYLPVILFLGNAIPNEESNNVAIMFVLFTSFFFYINVLIGFFSGELPAKDGKVVKRNVRPKLFIFSILREATYGSGLLCLAFYMSL